MGFTSV